MHQGAEPRRGQESLGFSSKSPSIPHAETEKIEGAGGRERPAGRWAVGSERGLEKPGNVLCVQHRLVLEEEPAARRAADLGADRKLNPSPRQWIHTHERARSIDKPEERAQVDVCAEED